MKIVVSYVRIGKGLLCTVECWIPNEYLLVNEGVDILGEKLYEEWGSPSPHDSDSRYKIRHIESTTMNQMPVIQKTIAEFTENFWTLQN